MNRSLKENRLRLKLAALVLWLAPAFGFSAIVFDSAGTANQTTVEATTLTISHTIGGGASRLAVLLVGSARDSAGSHTPTATYNGVAMTNCGGWQTAVASATFGIHCFYLKEASLPAAGTYNAVVTSTVGDSFMEGNVVSYTGVDQTTPVSGGTATGTTNNNAPTVTGTSASGDVALGFVMWRNTQTVSVNGGETSRFNDHTSSTSILSGAGSDEAGAASTNLLWALSGSTSWKMGFISIKAAAVTRRRDHVS